MKRTCKKCGETKPIEEFRKNKNCSTGFESICMGCRKQQQIEYAKAHEEKIKLYKKEYWIKNIEHLIECKRRFYQNNKEIILRKNKEYRLINKEKIQTRGKKYRQDNKEEIKQRKKEYVQTHREQVRRYRSNNKEHINTQARGYYKINPERYREYYYKEKLTGRYRDRIHRNERKRTENITDRYVISLIKKSLKLKSSTIRQYPEFIGNYRMQIKTKRLLKQKKNENIKAGKPEITLCILE